MRIALLTAHYPPAAVPCGIGDYTHCLREAFETLGHQCFIITSECSHSQEKDVYRVAGRWGARDTLAAWRILRAIKPDVVMVQYTPEHYGYGVAFKLLPLQLRWAGWRAPVVITFHTLIGGRWVAKLYAVLLSAECHGIVSIHTELSELYRRRLPWWAGKLRQIPIGANIPAPTMERGASREFLRRRLGVAQDAAILGTFGFPTPGKGLETLFQALRLLNESSVVHVVCVGAMREEDRAYRTHLESLARRLEIDRRLHWLGELPEEEASNLLAGADVYVVPYDEGASLRRGTLMAGFRIGVPIVTTAPRYPDPSLRPGETILAVPPRAPEALAECIRDLLADPGTHEKLRQGVSRIVGRFEWKTIAEEHVQFAMHLRKQLKLPV
jgi:glycosyltransferase involved in cell wall biosynthesis